MSLQTFCIIPLYMLDCRSCLVVPKILVLLTVLFVLVDITQDLLETVVCVTLTGKHFVSEPKDPHSHIDGIPFVVLDSEVIDLPCQFLDCFEYFLEFIVFRIVTID